jgi:hypothetical protein
VQGFSSRSSDLGEFNAGLDRLLDAAVAESAQHDAAVVAADEGHLAPEIGTSSQQQQNTAGEPTAPTQMATISF